MFSDFIDDGYTEQGYIAADAGVHGAHSFTYRPILLQRRDVISKLPNEQFAGEAAKELAKALKSWTVKDRNGSVPKIDAENVGRLKPSLLDKLWLVIAGYRASDQHPDRDEKPPAVDPEADAKNLQQASG